MQFQSNELNVSEAMGTVEVTVIANGTCRSNYAVNLTTSDITTGGIIVLYTHVLCWIYTVDIGLPTYRFK